MSDGVGTTDGGQSLVARNHSDEPAKHHGLYGTFQEKDWWNSVADFLEVIGKGNVKEEEGDED